MPEATRFVRDAVSQLTGINPNVAYLVRKRQGDPVWRRRLWVGYLERLL